MLRNLLVAFCLLVLIGGAQSAAAQQPPSWDKLKFLIGHWTGEGSGTPGQGEGWYDFRPDLGGQVLVRTNHASYPATKERPAFSHDDLMVIYREPGSSELRATYWDSEGHLIQYRVEPSASGSSVVFISDPAPQQPRYRLSYNGVQPEMVTIKFEIAPPGQPNQFKLYLEATAHRSGTPAK